MSSAQSSYGLQSAPSSPSSSQRGSRQASPVLGASADNNSNNGGSGGDLGTSAAAAAAALLNGQINAKLGIPISRNNSRTAVSSPLAASPAMTEMPALSSSPSSASSLVVAATKRHRRTKSSQSVTSLDFLDEGGAVTDAGAGAGAGVGAGAVAVAGDGGGGASLGGMNRLDGVKAQIRRIEEKRKGSKAYTVYVIRVTQGEAAAPDDRAYPGLRASWVVQRRYSEFAALDKKCKEFVPGLSEVAKQTCPEAWAGTS